MNSGGNSTSYAERWWLSLHSEPDWGSLVATLPNTLFEGPAAAAEALIQLLMPHLQEPVVWRAGGYRLELPAGEAGALILQDVDELDPNEQARLLRWLVTRRTQIVSTTTRPLFELVRRGLFDATLYYRLNAVLVHVEDRIRRATPQMH